jgi:O-succinylhomoserine sulfhydrylase
MSPFNAWVFTKGLETLKLRMRAHCENAQGLAQWLSGRAGVRRVHYPGLPDHPHHELAGSQQSGYGGIVSFELDGGREAAWRLIDATRMLSITANLGDAKSTVTHPATTTHGRLSQADRDRAGIVEGLIRVSVGLEDLDDICKDIARGL